MASARGSDVTSTPVTAGPVAALRTCRGVAARRVVARGDSRQSTLCAASWGRPVCASAASAPDDAERIVPPFSASVFPSTAMPRVE